MKVSKQEAVPDGAEDPRRSALMQAVVQHAYGPVDVLRLAAVPRPVIGADDVLVRVRAAALHIGDWHLMTGEPYLMRVMGFGLRAPKAVVRGTDLSGSVVEVGEAVTAYAVGDDVFGTGDGAFAEYTTARQDALAPKPARLTFEQAAAVPTSACTALQALRAAGEIAPGQRVLVVGASGGVGLFAVQLAKASGAVVTGVCRTEKVGLVRSVGADHVLDHTRDELDRDGGGYDVILDLGGTRTLRQLRRVLAPRGTLVLVGGEGGGRWVGGAMVRSLRALVLSPYVSQQLKMIVATTTAGDLQLLSRLVEAGSLTPVIDRVLPLSEARDAFRHLLGGHAQGKVILTPR